jgi:hypothetical protein
MSPRLHAPLVVAVGLCIVFALVALAVSAHKLRMDLQRRLVGERC